MAGMSNEEITNEFNSLFGGGDESEVDEVEETEVDDTEAEETEIETEDESEDKQDEPEEEDSEDDGQEDKPKAKGSASTSEKKDAQQNYAFAQQRKQIKEQQAFIDSIGRLIGMDGASQEDIQNRVKEVLLDKEAKEKNVSVELLQRLDRAEAILQENNQIKREKEVQGNIANLIERHSLTKEQVDEFIEYLIDNDKNPMVDGNVVDIEAEYLKLHYDDMIQAAVDAAMDKENKRKEKVSKKAGSKVPGSHDSGEDGPIDSVKSLDNLFDSIDL